jgi:predicted Rossmann-fold nucleotide-binding protein
VLPGGIGTLEEVVEILSWRRLGLHAKPVVFLDTAGFWRPLFDLLQHTVDQRLSPATFTAAWTSVERVEDLIPALRAGLPAIESAEPAAMRVT